MSVHQKKLLNLITTVGRRHSQWQAFSDFVEMAAISISNGVDLARRKKREERYMQIVKQYDSDELNKFPEMLSELVLAMEEAPADVLGRTYHELGLHNKWVGQYFTPYEICRMVSRMTIGEPAEMQKSISGRGFITVNEPACGSGTMIIAFAQDMQESGFNYQRDLHVTAVDVDSKCVHMAFLQLSLMHIPAVIVHGNTLSLEERDHWFTPNHILNGWGYKLRRREETVGMAVSAPGSAVSAIAPGDPQLALF